MKDLYEHYPQHRPMPHPGSDEAKELRKRQFICPICMLPKVHYRLYGYRCPNPAHAEMERNLGKP